MLPPLNPRRSKHFINDPCQVKNSKTKLKINFNNGRFEIIDAYRWQSHWREPYYLMLMIPWWGFFILTAIAYVVIN